MVDKVVITEEENNPSVEEQAKAQEAPAQEAPVETSNERPEWLPEKFANAEELAKAYGALEKKMSSKPEEPVKEADLKIQSEEEIKLVS